MQTINYKRFNAFVSSVVTTVILVVGSLALTSCGGDKTSETPAKYTGRIIDSAVQNIKYETASRSGRTSSDGSFPYDDPNELVTFSIGDMSLGSAQVGPTVHIYDLSLARMDSSGATGNRIAQILQSLDQDKDLTNGIQLPETAHTELSSASAISLLDANWNAKLGELIQKIGGNVVGIDAAAQHANSTLVTETCSLAPHIYSIPEDSKQIDTTTLSCQRRAALAVYFDYIKPNLESNAYSYLANDFLQNAVDISDKQKKVIDGKLRIRNSIENISTLVDDGVDLFFPDEITKEKFVAGAVKFAADAVARVVGLLCVVETDCSPDHRKEAEATQSAIAAMGSIVKCRARDWPSCAEALGSIPDIIAILVPEELQKKNAADQAKALAQVVVDVFKAWDQASTFTKSRDPGAGILFSAKVIRIMTDAYIAVQPKSATSNRTLLDNTILVFGKAAEAIASCAAVAYSKTIEAKAKAGAACFETATISIYDNLVTIGTDTAFLLVAGNMERTGRSYQIASVALREILSFNSLREASLAYAPEYNKLGGTELGKYHLATNTFDAQAYFRVLINHLYDRWFIPPYQIIRPGFDYTVFRAEIDYDLIRERISSDLTTILYSRVPKILDNTQTTCEVLQQGSLNVNSVNATKAIYITPNSLITLDTSFSSPSSIRSYIIEWGDGSAVETGNSPTSSHKYATPGAFKARIRPTVVGPSGPRICPGKSTLIVTGTPTVMSVSPTSSAMGVSTIISIIGRYLPLTAVLAVPDAVCVAPVGNSVSGFTQACTFTVAIGSKQLKIYTDDPSQGGKLVDSSHSIDLVSFTGLGGNDTGQTSCIVSGAIVSSCPTGSLSEPNFGRDAAWQAGALKKIGDGAAGMDFTKIDATGLGLPTTANNWACVRDNVTGLIWETKTSDGGIRDKSRIVGTYTGKIGELINYLVSLKLCGRSDWRVPQPEEFIDLAIYRGLSPANQAGLTTYDTRDTVFFPDWIVEGTTGSFGYGGYWAGSSFGGSAYSYAIQAYFDPNTGMIGYGEVESTDPNRRVRLVAGTTPTGADRYDSSANLSTAYDRIRDITWMVCPIGTVFKSGSGCAGGADAVAFPDIQSALAEYPGWRLPNIKELISLNFGGPVGMPSLGAWSSTYFDMSSGLILAKSGRYYNQPILADTKDASTKLGLVLVRDGR